MTGQQLIDTVQLSPEGHAYIRIRQPNWAEQSAYLRLSVLAHPDGTRNIGPWAHLFSRQTQALIGEPTPQVVTTLPALGPFNLNAFLTGEVVEWIGARDPEDAYTHGG